MKIVLTAELADRSEKWLCNVNVKPGDTPDSHELIGHAKRCMTEARYQDDMNERRMVRTEAPRTVSVRADLMDGGRLVDREEYRL